MYYYNMKNIAKFISIKYAYGLKTYDYFHRNIDININILCWHPLIYKYKEKF